MEGSRLKNSNSLTDALETCNQVGISVLPAALRSRETIALGDREDFQGALPKHRRELNVLLDYSWPMALAYASSTFSAMTLQSISVLTKSLPRRVASTTAGPFLKLASIAAVRPPTLPVGTTIPPAIRNTISPQPESSETTTGLSHRSASNGTKPKNS